MANVCMCVCVTAYSPCVGASCMRVCICGYDGRLDRRSAGRDKCSNLSSPSHSHPSAQTSKSLPLGLPCSRTRPHTHTCAYRHRPHINPIPNSHFSPHRRPKSKNICVSFQRYQMRQHRSAQSVLVSINKELDAHLRMHAHAVYTQTSSHALLTCTDSERLNWRRLA